MCQGYNIKLLEYKKIRTGLGAVALLIDEDSKFWRFRDGYGTTLDFDYEAFKSIDELESVASKAKF